MNLTKQQRQKRTAYIIIGALALLAALSSGVVLLREPRLAACPRDGQYPRTVILIDATDRLDAEKIGAVWRRAEELIDDLSPREWVGVFVLSSDDLFLPTPEIARCNPGNQCNSLVENCGDVELDFQKKFKSPLKNVINQLRDLPPQNESPILEMISAVARDHNFNTTQRRRLVVVSDMLQKTDAYSHYTDGYDFAKWRTGDYAREFLRLSLSGVEVEIWYVKRNKFHALQTPKHVEFWEQYFAATGADIQVKPLIQEKSL